MLKADLDLHDLDSETEWVRDSIMLGRSRIDPCRHPALETLLVRTQGQWFVTVRERLADHASRQAFTTETVDAEQFNRLYQACLLWPLDYVLVEAAQLGRRIRVRSGVLGSAPIYCRIIDDHLKISWDIADFIASPLSLDFEIASRRLALRSTYTCRQLFIGIVLLTERASLYMEPGKAHYQYPAAVENAAPSLPAGGDDGLACFEAHLHRITSMRPADTGQIATELSGGMDSAAVACALGAQHRPIMSLGILLEGELGHAQRERRRHMTARLGLLDTTVDIAAFPPSLDLRLEAGKPYPFVEYYLEAFEALWQAAARQGRQLLFTGLGGDELFPAYPGETRPGDDGNAGFTAKVRDRAERLLTPRALAAARVTGVFDAPAGPVPPSALLANASQAPHLLRHGLWPVNPLSDPSLVAFCHRLPAGYRLNREVMRRYLRNCLGNEVFPAGYAKETFVDVLPALISRQHQRIATQLRECALADLGLVEQPVALALLDEVAATQANVPTTLLANFLWLERLARRTCH